MRLTARPGKLLRIPLFLLLVDSQAFAEIRVRCSTPGEEVACEDDQVAVCDVRTGRIFASCHDAKASASSDAGRGEFLHRLLGEQVTSQLDSEAEERILKSGEWRSKDRAVTFKVPANFGSGHWPVWGR